MRVRNHQRSTSLLMTILALACGAATPTLAESVKPRVVTLAPRVPGAQYPRLIELTDGNAVLLWTGEDHVTWAQRVNPAKGLLANIARVGQLTSGDSRLSRDPVPVSMPNGDLALVGLLADGRIAFARGSSSGDRRVAARVIVPATQLNVIGFAAAATADGIAVLVLRSVNATELKGTMDLSLYALDAWGAEARPPVTWKSPTGHAARMAVCNGTTFFSWETSRGVVTAHLDASGKRSRETPIAGGKGEISLLGPLVCSTDGAQLLTGWERSDGAHAAAIGGALLQDPKPRWRLTTLPGTPESTLGGDPMLAAYAASGRVHLVLDKQRVVDLDLATHAVTPRATDLAAGSCMPLAQGTSAICGSSKREPTAPGCRTFQAQPQVALVNAGESDAKVEDNFWKPGEIEGVDAPSAAARTQEAEVVRCGQEQWPALRDALAQWCGSQKSAAANSYCSKDSPSSLLYQAINCTDQPLACGVGPRVAVPSVRRAEIAAGRVEMKYGNCSVYLVGKGNSWRVNNADCEGD
jgi:hypothetical protein